MKNNWEDYKDYCLEIDRMINEGLAGGRTHDNYSLKQLDIVEHSIKSDKTK